MDPSIGGGGAQMKDGDPGRLVDRTAIVTGAGRGIGAALVRRLVGEGARVLACDLDREPLEALHDQLGVEFLVGDVTAEDFGERAVEQALRLGGGVDIVVNNAGYIWNTTIQNTTDEQWHAMLEVHATAPFRLLRALTPFLREAARREEEEGRVRFRKVVNVSSVSGLYGAATQLAYASAKSALLGLTRTLAKEWGRYGVNVNAVAFGWIGTRLTQDFEDRPAEIEVGGRSYRVGFPRRVARAMETRIPLGRRGTPEEAAGALLLLCLPESDYISGQVLVCDGGAGADQS